jgi:hypothetical protein
VKKAIMDITRRQHNLNLNLPLVNLIEVFLMKYLPINSSEFVGHDSKWRSQDLKMAEDELEKYACIIRRIRETNDPRLKKDLYLEAYTALFGVVKRNNDLLRMTGSTINLSYDVLHETFPKELKNLKKTAYQLFRVNVKTALALQRIGQVHTELVELVNGL